MLKSWLRIDNDFFRCSRRTPRSTGCLYSFTIRAASEACNPAAIGEETPLNEHRISELGGNFVIGRLTMACRFERQEIANPTRTSWLREDKRDPPACSL
jgi:hypothetical protein